jgi:hypothetical protein
MTVALAQALRVAVPSNLSKPEIMNKQLEFNPLQPSRPMSGTTPNPPTLTASPTAAFIQSSKSYPRTQLNSLAQLTPAMDNQQLQSPPFSPTALPQAQSKRPRRAMYFALIACVVLLLVGSGAFALSRLLSQNNATTSQNSSDSVVGHITFIHSSSAPSNTFDQLRIILNTIPSLPAGKAYYAWLENSNSELSGPHWELPISNGAVNYLTPVDTSRPDLLDHNITFLITAQDTGVAFNNPPPDLSTHLYYAIISATSSSFPTLEVKQCPSSGTNCF